MSSFILIIKYEQEAEDKVINELKTQSNKFIIKSKSIKEGHVELIAEARLPKDNKLSASINNIDGVLDISQLAYSSNILDN